MGRRRQISLVLQVGVLVVASLLEVAANFAANDVQSGAVRTLVRFALPAVLVLMVLLVVGNVFVLRLERPAADRPAWSPGRAPYPGLAAFSEDDAAVYFGREGQVADLIRRLHAGGVDAAGRFVCVTGASGSGKTSLVHAGVVPRLRARRWSVLPTVVPASEPLAQLTSMLRAQIGIDAREVERRLRCGEAVLAGVGSRFGRVLLVLDQLEELVTLSSAGRRASFLDAVAGLLAADRRVWVLATLRVEFLPELLDSPQARLFASPAVLGALRQAELVAVIERPAALGGLTLEQGLVADAVEDTDAVDALPLLAYLLQELYLGAGGSGVITREAYRKLGGVAGALARQADEVFAGLAGEHGADAVLATLFQLVGMEGGEPARRRVPLSGLTPVERAIVTAFTDARLLVTTAAMPDGGAAVVQVAHEALFRQWPPLRQHVAARAEQLRGRSELERWAADWQRSGRSTDYLLTGERLALAGRWIQALQETGQVPEQASALIAASRGRDTAYLRQVSEAIGSTVLANAERDPQFGIALALAALTECPPTPIAVQALMASLAHSHAGRILVGHSGCVRAVAWSPDGSRIASAARDGTVRIWDTHTDATLLKLDGQGGLLDAVAWSPDSVLIAACGRGCPIIVFDARTGARVAALDLPEFTRDLAFSPDGRWLATGSRDRLIRVFDTRNWQLVTELAGHGNEIWGVAWSPDGHRIVSVSHDKTVVIWDVDTGDALETFHVRTRLMEGVDWSSDGARIVASTADRRIMIWSANQDRAADLSTSYPETPASLRWSPDNACVAFVCGDRAVRIWNVDRNDEIAVMRGHVDVVWSVSWSPDGTRLVTGSEDATVRVWHATASGAELIRLGEHETGVRALALSPDGRHAISVSYDGTRIWDLTAARQFAPAEGDGRVRALSWSPDGDSIATSDDDGVIRMLHAASQRQRAAVTLPAMAEAIAWSPQGQRLAAGSRDSLIRVLDGHTGEELASLAGHTDWVNALAWSPCGRYLASGSDDRSVRIWDVDAAQTVHTLRGHRNWIDGAAWSPDGKHLATCSGDWTIRIWDPATGEPTATLIGHEQRVRAIAWSPDGTRLASVSNDCTVRMWNPDGSQQSTVIGVHRKRVRTVAWLPDGRHVITGAIDATVRIWRAELDLDALLSTARSQTVRELTDEERRAHLLPQRD